MNVGCLAVAADSAILVKTLTVGKEYEIIKSAESDTGLKILIQDDDTNTHWYHSNFFTIKSKKESVQPYQAYEVLWTHYDTGAMKTDVTSVVENSPVHHANWDTKDWLLSVILSSKDHNHLDNFACNTLQQQYEFMREILLGNVQFAGVLVVKKYSPDRLCDVEDFIWIP